MRKLGFFFVSIAVLSAAAAKSVIADTRHDHSPKSKATSCSPYLCAANNLSELTSSASSARGNIGAAASGLNSDITGINQLVSGMVWNGPNTQWTDNGASGEGIIYKNGNYQYGTNQSGSIITINVGDGIYDWDLTKNAGNTGAFGLLTLYDALANPGVGNRQVALATFAMAQTPMIAGTYSAVTGQAQLQTPAPSPAGFGFPDQASLTVNDYNGNNFGGNETLYSTTYNHSYGLSGDFGMEIDQTNDANSSSLEKIGLVVGTFSGGTLSSRTHQYREGTITNIGYDLFGPYDCDFCTGKPNGDHTQDQDTTEFGAYVNQYGTIDSNPMFRYQIDGRPFEYLGGSIAEPGFGVSTNGLVGASELTTSVIEGETATLQSGVVRRPGFYTSLPTFSVQAPTNGTTATMTTSTVALVGEASYSSTGSGYAVGDLLNGAGFTFKVTAIDGNGGIMAGTLAASGTANNNYGASEIVQSPTGGSGTGAMLYIHWTFDKTNYFVPLSSTSYLFAATGKGYKAGDTITLTGDGGIEGVETVGTVSPTGGLIMGNQTLSTRGAMTGIATNSPHSITTSGSGMGAAVQFGFGLASVSVTPGSGYQVQPLPIVTPSVSAYGNADVVPVMNGAEAPLSVNPAGKPTTFGGNVTATSVAATNGTNTATLAQAANNGYIYDYGANMLTWNSSSLWTNQAFTTYGPSTAAESFYDSVVSSKAGSYTFAASDCGTHLTFDGSAAATFTVPAGLPVGCVLSLINDTTFAVTLAAGSGETLNAPSGALQLNTQYIGAHVLARTSSVSIANPGF